MYNFFHLATTSQVITDIPDHFGVFHVAYENMKVENHPTYIQVRQLKKENIQKLKNDLATADYTHLYSQPKTQMMLMIYV